MKRVRKSIWLPMEVRERILFDRREELGWSQTELGRKLGKMLEDQGLNPRGSNIDFQSTICSYEGGGQRHIKTPKYLAQLERILGINLKVEPESGLTAVNLENTVSSPEHSDLLLGPGHAVARLDDSGPTRNFLPVYTLTPDYGGLQHMGASVAEWKQGPTPLNDVSAAYGLNIADETMEPKYEPGDTAWVHPHAVVKPGHNVVFFQRNRKICIIRKLLSHSPTDWLVRQYNPPSDYMLSKTLWTDAERIHGSSDR